VCPNSDFAEEIIATLYRKTEAEVQVIKSAFSNGINYKDMYIFAKGKGDYILSFKRVKNSKAKLSHKSFAAATLHYSLPTHNFWEIKRKSGHQLINLSIKKAIESDHSKILFLHPSDKNNLRSENISKLQHLEYLSLANCNYSEIPNHIIQLDSLKIIDFSQNPISVIPEEIENIKTLEEVFLSECNSLEIDSVLQVLKNVSLLNHLTLSHNRNVEILPMGITKLKKLESLNLSKCKNIELKECFNILKDCENLKKLNLSACNISKLPPLTGNLLNLEELNLSSNSLNFHGLLDFLNASENSTKIILSNTTFSERQREELHSTHPKIKFINNSKKDS